MTARWIAVALLLVCAWWRWTGSCSRAGACELIWVEEVEVS